MQDSNFVGSKLFLHVNCRIQITTSEFKEIIGFR